VGASLAQHVPVAVPILSTPRQEGAVVTSVRDVVEAAGREVAVCAYRSGLRGLHRSWLPKTVA
jgi:hypothetical protein